MGILVIIWVSCWDISFGLLGFMGIQQLQFGFMGILGFFSGG